MSLWLVPLLPPVVLTLAGHFLVRALGLSGGRIFRLGLSVLLGIGGGTTLLFAAALLSVPLRPGTVFGILGLFTVGAAAAALIPPRKARTKAEAGGPGGGRLPWTATEAFLALLVLFLFGLAAVKANFFPVLSMDGHSYDGRARWIAAEGTLDLAYYHEYEIPSSNNLTYPPLFPLALALGHWMGRPGKGIMPFFFIALLAVVHGFLRRRLSRLGALAAALALAATPELWNHASLTLTNLPAAAFLGAGVLLAAVGVEDGPGPRTPVWAAAGLLLAFAAGVRSDALVVALPAALILAAVRARQRPRSARRGLALLLWLLVPALLLSAAWQFELRRRIGLSPGLLFRTSLLPDSDLAPAYADVMRRILFNPGLYGWTFPLLGLVIPLTWILARGKSRRRLPAGSPFWLLLGLTVAAGLTLVALFQQLDPRFGGGPGEIMSTSFKRAAFYLVPTGVAALFLAPPVRAALAAADAWQRSARPARRR